MEPVIGRDIDAGNPSAPHRVRIPPNQPFLATLRSKFKEAFLADDPLRQFQGQPFSRQAALSLQYFFPVLEWAPEYTLWQFKSDLTAGITTASLAIPQGVSYARLAKLPPVLGLYSSFVPPLVYAMMGTSRDLAVGTIAAASLLFGSTLGQAASPLINPDLYLHLTFTATLFAGVFQAALGILRLGFIVDVLSHAAIVGFMGGAATVVCLQQLKEILGLQHFTTSTDIVNVMKSVLTQRHQWQWESAVMGLVYLFILLLARMISKNRPKLFLVSAAAPLTSVILGSIIAYAIQAEKHGIQVIGELKKGLNPPSLTHLTFRQPYLPTTIKTGVVTGIIALAEGIAVGRSFAVLKSYHIDGNKEMIAFGLMNIAGSFTSCYLTSGPFSRAALNSNAGCKTAVSNIVMATAVMITLLFLTPLFHYTPLVVLSSIIITAVVGSIDYKAAGQLWKVDKIDFCVCVGAYLGVVFDSLETGLAIAIGVSVMRVLWFIARPRTTVLGNIPNTTIYRRKDHYPEAKTVPGILVLQIDAPIYFANASYLRARISRWIHEEEDKLAANGQHRLVYVILEMGAVTSIDTSGIAILQELKKTTDRRELKLVLSNPGSEVMKKLNKSKVLQEIGQECVYLTVGEAVTACSFILRTHEGAAAPEGGGEGSAIGIASAMATSAAGE